MQHIENQLLNNNIGCFDLGDRYFCLYWVLMEKKRTNKHCFLAFFNFMNFLNIFSNLLKVDFFFFLHCNGSRCLWTTTWHCVIMVFGVDRNFEHDCNFDLWIYHQLRCSVSFHYLKFLRSWGCYCAASRCRSFSRWARYFLSEPILDLFHVKPSYIGFINSMEKVTANVALKSLMHLSLSCNANRLFRYNIPSNFVIWFDPDASLICCLVSGY